MNCTDPRNYFMASPKLTAAAPRLSQTLKPFTSRKQCQQCSTTVRPVTGWIEHDHEDKPEPIYIFVCDRCEGLLIESHPRLYRQFQKYEPLPGVQDFCVDCKWRQGCRCTCPKAKINGGPGIKMDQPEPASAFVDGPKFRGRMLIWHSPARDCTGRETA